MEVVPTTPEAPALVLRTPDVPISAAPHSSHHQSFLNLGTEDAGDIRLFGR